MKIAVIGLGNIGGQVATALVEAGQPIMVVDHGSGKAQVFADKSHGKARATATAEAIAEADIIIFGVYFNVIKELLSRYRDKLAGKIIVDPSNPIAPDGKGGFKKTSLKINHRVRFSPACFRRAPSWLRPSAR